MEIGISRRMAIAGGLAALCGAVVPQMALANDDPVEIPEVNNAKDASESDGTPALKEIEELLQNLSDEDLKELDRMVLELKSARGMDSLPFGSGIYMAGESIDPGSYTVWVTVIDEYPYINFTIEEPCEEGSPMDIGSGWASVSYNSIKESGPYQFTLKDGERLKCSIEGGTCTISPTKKISF